MSGTHSMTAAEYSDSVREWLLQAYQWHAIAHSFPSFLAYQASLHHQSSSNSGITTSSTTTTEAASTEGRRRQTEEQPQEIEWHEFTIPPLWKRIVAELIDFFILFVLKLVVTYIAVDWFSLIDVDRIDISFLTAAASGGTTGRSADLDFQSAVDLTSDFVILESIHRLVVCVFEALCLHRGFGGRPGGATPGKYAMGLRVVSCFQVITMPEPNRVQITPAKDIGIIGSTIRAVLKNAAMAFFVPVFFTFVYNRTVYDFMSKSIVVEDRNNARERPGPHQD